MEIHLNICFHASIHVQHQLHCRKGYARLKWRESPTCLDPLPFANCANSSTKSQSRLKHEVGEKRLSIMPDQNLDAEGMQG
jgi:hypothetical protein